MSRDLLDDGAGLLIRSATAALAAVAFHFWHPPALFAPTPEVHMKPTPITAPLRLSSMPAISRSAEAHPVRLTDAERRERGIELARAQLTVTDNAALMKDRIKLLKDEHKGLSAERDRLTEIVHDGYEPRSVEVEVRADFAAAKAYVVRLDTFEVVRVRDLDDDELDAEQDLFSRTGAAGDNRP